MTLELKNMPHHLDYSSKSISLLQDLGVQVDPRDKYSIADPTHDGTVSSLNGITLSADGQGWSIEIRPDVTTDMLERVFGGVLSYLLEKQKEGELPSSVDASKPLKVTQIKNVFS